MFFFFFSNTFLHNLLVVLGAVLDSLRVRVAPLILLLRPFLMQSDLPVENGLFRLKPKSGFLTQSKKGFFDSTFFD